MSRNNTHARGWRGGYFPDATGVVAGGTRYVWSAADHPNGLLAAGHFGNGQVFSQTLDPREWL